MQQFLLVAAHDLYDVARHRIAADYRTATNPWPYALVLVLFGLTVVGLVVLQWRLSSRFHRTFNVGVAVATILVLGASIWFGVALRGESRQLDLARAAGLRSDRRLHPGADPGPASAVRRRAGSGHPGRGAFVPDRLRRHRPAAVGPARRGRIRRGSSTSRCGMRRPSCPAWPARTTASGAPTPRASWHGPTRWRPARAPPACLPSRTASTDSCGHAVEVTQGNFAARTAAAQNDLAGIYLGLAALGILAVAMVLWGAQQRIEEYR